MSHIGFVILSFGILYFLLLLFRIKPLLTINNTEIIIFHPLRKKMIIPFKDVAGFYISTNSHKGIKNSDQVNIIMKATIPRGNKMIKTSPPPFEYLNYTIAADLLNIKTKKLITILNSYLETAIIYRKNETHLLPHSSGIPPMA
ncbi:hypothetical protein CHA01nite_33090 [Chryseobacterium hagamense]|uniref:Uncharacterized protein n=2 Tax=Chryseobacterium hagamense TaxID=395935 RepID=A0A511YQV3_9FLAO|nr:hypothetical protein CHA01nite_33090 [Chryseobacterium hagamense]